MSVRVEDLFRGPGGAAWNPNMADRWAVWPAYGRPFRGWILGQTLLALWVHWEGSRNVICPGRKTCERCREGKPRKAQYHVSAWDGTLCHAVLLVLGGRAAAALAEEATRQGHLRGLRVTITKEGRGNRAPYTCDLVSDDAGNGRLPGAQDIEELARRIYAVPQLPEYGERG